MLLKPIPTSSWALIASLFIGNVILLIMNLPMVPCLLVRSGSLTAFFTRHYLICVNGVSSLTAVSHVWAMLIFGVAGIL